MAHAHAVAPIGVQGLRTEALGETRRGERLHERRGERLHERRGERREAHAYAVAPIGIQCGKDGVERVKQDDAGLEVVQPRARLAGRLRRPGEQRLLVEGRARGGGRAQRRRHAFDDVAVWNMLPFLPTYGIILM